MSARPDSTFDDDNPEWTSRDFRDAKPASELPPEILAQFPKTRRVRGPQRTPTKVQVAVRLSRDVVEHFRAGGPGWHQRIDEALRQAAGLNSRPDRP